MTLHTANTHHSPLIPTGCEPVITIRNLGTPEIFIIVSRIYAGSATCIQGPKDLGHPSPLF